MSEKSRSAICLGAILAGALTMRLPALRWGLPPPIPHVIASDFRCSYAFDEDDVLTPVSFSKPGAWDFDPRMYDWGTLHLHLAQFWMEAAEAGGFIGAPWREAYYRMLPGAFERVYVAARLLSIVMALLSIALIFLLGREFGGNSTGLWAAALAAASPAHLLASVQVRVDLTMVTLVTLTMYLAVRALRSKSSTLLLWMGLAAGLAVAAKYSAAVAVAPVLAVTLWKRGGRPATWAWVAGAGLAGFVAGQPYVLVKGQEMFRQTYEILTANLTTPPDFRIPVPTLIATHTIHAARFLVGLPAFLLATVGLWAMVRRRSAEDIAVLCCLAGGVAALIPLAWPLLRYQLPLVPALSLAAATALGRLSFRLRAVMGASALIFPLFSSLAQAAYMRSPHPANQALRLILDQVPPGSTIARLTPEMPPLDRKVYPLGPNPLLDDLAQNPAPWVLTADLPDREYPAANLELLRTGYELTAEFQIPRIFAWSTIGEAGAPHDWKYTHPRMALYRRRNP